MNQTKGLCVVGVRFDGLAQALALLTVWTASALPHGETAACSFPLEELS